MPMGGKGRYEVLILFENNGDNALQDVCINDLLPLNFELKDWSVRGAGRDKRDDVSLESETQDHGVLNVWTIPVVEKGERLEVSFEIKGDGEVDAEVLNQFHGVTFGDEVEEDIDSSNEKFEEESSKEESSEEQSSGDEPGEGYKWREDVLLRVMEAHGIDASLRDDFVRHAIKFDDDDNLYLKKSEIEAAAEAWGASGNSGESDDSTEEEVAEEEAPGEESPVAEEASVEESPVAEEAPVEESSDDSKTCMICNASNSNDATNCESCGFEF